MQMELAGNPDRDQQIAPGFAAEEQREPHASHQQQPARSQLPNFEDGGQRSHRDQQREQRKSSEVE
jgi:hypothetical protein